MLVCAIIGVIEDGAMLGTFAVVSRHFIGVMTVDNDTIRTKQLPLFDLDPTKVCVICKQVFPASNEFFHRHKSRKDGLSDSCKTCNKERASKWQQQNREKQRQTGARWREKHRVSAREYFRKRYQDNREQELERKRIAREKNPEKFRQKNREWTQNNPEKAQAKRLHHVARKHNAEGSFTDEDIKRMTQEQDGCCYYCSERTVLTVDHKTPLARGGSNYPDNLCMACRFCNSQKGARTEAEYWEWLNQKRDS